MRLGLRLDSVQYVSLEGSVPLVPVCEGGRRIRRGREEMPHPTLREPDPLLPLLPFKTCLASNGSGVFRPRRNSPFRPPPPAKKGGRREKVWCDQCQGDKEGEGGNGSEKGGRKGNTVLLQEVTTAMPANSGFRLPKVCSAFGMAYLIFFFSVLNACHGVIIFYSDEQLCVGMQLNIAPSHHSP